MPTNLKGSFSGTQSLQNHLVLEGKDRLCSSFIFGSRQSGFVRTFLEGAVSPELAVLTGGLLTSQ